MTREEFDTALSYASDPELDWRESTLLVAYSWLLSDPQLELFNVISNFNRCCREADRAKTALEGLEPLATQAMKDLDNISFSEVDHSIGEY